MIWAPIEKAIINWVRAASGLADGKVIWERQKGRRPTGTWVGLRRALGVGGRDWLDTVDKPLTLADDDVESVSAAADTLTLTAHSYVSGDGPFQLTTTDTLPDPLELATDYWIIVIDANTIKLADSFADSVNTPVPIDLTDAGVGTHTISGTSETVRAGEEIQHTVRGPRLMTLTMQCYGGTAAGDASPEAVLSNVKAKLIFPSIGDPLNAAGIGVATFSAVQPLDLSLGPKTDVRALMTVTAHLAEEVAEDGTFIETATITEDPPIS